MIWTITLSTTAPREEPKVSLITVDSYSSSGSIQAFGHLQPELSQSFTGVAANSSTASVWLKRIGSPTGPLYAKLYAHTGTYGTSSEPTGSALATSASVEASTISSGSSNEVIFTFSGVNRYTLTASTKYVLVLDSSSATTGASDYFELEADSSSPSHGGNYAGKISGTWTADNSIDLKFTYKGTTHAILDTNAATNVASSTATLNGDIDFKGGGNATVTGFVYGKSSKVYPGNVAPASSGYPNSVSSSGSFGVGSFSENVTGLDYTTTYFTRAFAQNTGGYSYGDEVQFSTLNTTTVTFTTTELATIFKTILDNYPGAITYTGGSVDNTGVSLTVKFVTNTILEGIQTVLDLAPSDWYYYVDVGTGVAYFKQTATTATHTFVRGRHLHDLKISTSIEELVNTFYFTGGDTGGGSNLFQFYRDDTSVAQYGSGLDRRTDNRVTLTATADAYSNGVINKYKDEIHHTVIQIPSEVYDIASIKPGDTVGFSGFSSYVDNLILQVVRLDYQPTKVRLEVGDLPIRQSSAFEKVRRDLISFQVINNPTSPS